MEKTPEQRIYYPTGVFGINRRSPQYQDLIGWWPGCYPGGDKLYRLDDYAPPIVGGEYDGLSGTGLLANNGKWAGSPMSLGASVVFNSVDNDHVDLGVPTQYETLNRNFSFGAWVNCMGVNPGAAYGIMTWGTFGPYLRINNDTMVLDFLQSQITPLVTGSTAITRGRWTHAFVTVSPDSGGNATLKLYLNGKLEGSTTNGVSFSTTHMHIGADADSGGPREYFHGWITDARIYNKELTAQQVKELYDPLSRYDLYQPIITSQFYDYLKTGIATADTGRNQVMWFQ